MSTSRGSLVEIQAKLLAKEPTAIEVLVMPGAIRLRVPILEEATCAWQNAAIGEMVTLRISQNLAERSDLFKGGPMVSRPIGRING